ncbi:MAG: putative oxidoreductase C-terminal domain-containing protein [Balneolaceae bacterium]|nr:putative oxidoreductase C-terminal domain-containing protein [Balneolaceae bacterium]
MAVRPTWVIRQVKEQNYTPTLYVEPTEGNGGEQYEAALKSAVEEISNEYPGLSLTIYRKRVESKYPG